MTKGKLIILNGGSSAGKTSLGKALQEILPEPYFLLGIDLFWFALPPRQLDLGRVEPQYYCTEDETIAGKEYFRIVPGPLLDAAMCARYRAIKAYLDYGLNVIADDVIWKRAWLEDTLRLLDGYDVLFIGVHVSDAEGERREIARGNRHGGWNRGSAEAAHRNAQGVYDFEIDTSNDSPAACARKLKEALDGGLKGTAFGRLRGKVL